MSLEHMPLTGRLYLHCFQPVPPAQAQSSRGLNPTTTTHVQGSPSPLPGPGTQGSETDWLDSASKALFVAFQGPVESGPGLCLSLFPLPHHVCVSDHSEAHDRGMDTRRCLSFLPLLPRSEEPG